MRPIAQAALGSGSEFSGYDLTPLDCLCDASSGGTRFVLGLAESGLMDVYLVLVSVASPSIAVIFFGNQLERRRSRSLEQTFFGFAPKISPTYAGTRCEKKLWIAMSTRNSAQDSNSGVRTMHEAEILHKR